MGLKNSAAQRR